MAYHDGNEGCHTDSLARPALRSNPRKDKVSASSRCAMEQQPVQRHDLRLQRIQFDQRQRAFRDFAPAVHAGFGLLHFAAGGPAQKFASIVNRSRFAQRGTGQRFNGITPQQLAPILMEELAGCENIAPRHFAAISDDHADDALTLQPGSGAGESPLQLLYEAVHGSAHAPGLVDFPVRLRRRFRRNGFREIGGADAWLRSIARRERTGCSGHGAPGNRGPHFGLLLVHRSLLADAGVHDGLRRGELRATARPAAVLHAENIEWQRLGANRHDAILADNAILLAAADQFSGQQQQRTLAAVDEHELVYRGACAVIRDGVNSIAVAHHADSPALADDHVTAREAFFQRQKAAGVLRGAANHGKNRNVFVDDWIEDAQIAFRTGSGLMWVWSSPNKSEASKSGDGRQGGNGNSEKRALHGTSLQGIRKTCSGIRTGRLRFLARKQN